MAALRTRRKAAKKTLTPRRKKSPSQPKTRVGSRRRGARARVAAVGGKARAVAVKVRAVGARLAKGAAAAVKALRPREPRVEALEPERLPPSPETNGALTDEERIESSKYHPRH